MGAVLEDIVLLGGAARLSNLQSISAVAYIHIELQTATWTLHVITLESEAIFRVILNCWQELGESEASSQPRASPFKRSVPMSRWHDVNVCCCDLFVGNFDSRAWEVRQKRLSLSA